MDRKRGVTVEGPAIDPADGIASIAKACEATVPPTSSSNTRTPSMRCGIDFAIWLRSMEIRVACPSVRKACRAALSISVLSYGKNCAARMASPCTPSRSNKVIAFASVLNDTFHGDGCGSLLRAASNMALVGDEAFRPDTGSERETDASPGMQIFSQTR